MQTHTLIYISLLVNCFNKKYLLENHTVDFKGEAITFRTTTSAVLDTLAHCIDLMMQREEAWRKRVEKEAERRKRAENISKSYFQQLQKANSLAHLGPDLEVCIKL